MSLATRIVPVLLHKGHALYKGEGFNAWRSVGHATQAMRIHQARGVDEMMVLNIEATVKGNRPDFHLIEELSSECFVPLTIGGGIRTMDDVKCALDCGADKVAICSIALEEPTRMLDISEHWGSQAMVIVIEVKNGKVTSHNGTKEWPIKPIVWAKTVEEMGAGEIVLSSVERDGKLCGYDLELIREISKVVKVPVVAMGGCGKPDDALAAIKLGASAIAVGAMFQFTDETPKSLAKYLQKNGVEVRL